ncbi:MAG TPA: UbiA family prenyltransferase [Chitinophagaceae bacterium]|nr:UbiA family prenyltransferase [Chitinophagaceae bacterium]
MLHRSTIQLLRFHFSFFLLPVYLFSISQVNQINWYRAILIFFILHLLVYPSSNGYNSYMDRDAVPIGGLLNPLQPTRQLFFVSIGIDSIAVLLSCLISFYFAAGVLLYIMASRAYSYRGIRLKKYPVTGYLTVVTFQGTLIFYLSYHGSGSSETLNVPLIPMLAATFLIGGYYPLTQIYQHEDDRKDDVRTISMLMGKKGTFIFCGIIFVMATLLMFLTFQKEHSIRSFLTFTICMLPMTIFFTLWMKKVWKDESNANFINSLRMNILASACTTICFIILIIFKHFE